MKNVIFCGFKINVRVANRRIAKHGFYSVAKYLLQCSIKWIDEKNLVMCAEAGIIGQDLERRVCVSSSNHL